VSCNRAAYSCAKTAPSSDLVKLCEKSNTACGIMCVNLRNFCSQDGRSDRCDIVKNLPACNAPDHTNFGSVMG
jgi:hypothetical protein